VKGQVLSWLPAVILSVGALATVGIDVQQSRQLRTPLGSAIPADIAGFTAHDLTLSHEEQEAAAATTYLLRNYAPASTGIPGFSVFIGYYDRQTQGRTIHSPKNCLPGAGWEALASEQTSISTGGGSVPVNRYLIQRGAERALVLYWYQGRQRAEANEYVVKWNLLRDAALRKRTEEALVRIVVPITKGADAAFELASQAAAAVSRSLNDALPT